MKKLFLFLSTCLLVSSPSFAQDRAPSRQDLALAAGYKSMFTCSAVFNAGKSVAQIEEDELDNIYPDFTRGMSETEGAIIDRVKKTVSVKFLPDMPPRVSAWREHLGCSALPQGANIDDIKVLPRVKLKTPPDNLADVNWPMGCLLYTSPSPRD